MANWQIVAIVTGGLALSACGEKGGMPVAKGSGPLAAGERELLAHLPAGGNVVFGGNYFGLQEWMSSSPLARFHASMEPESAAWNHCLATGDFTMAGTARYRDDVLRMTMFMHGLELSRVIKCSADAGLPVTADPDGKFVAVRLTSTGDLDVDMPYLDTGDGVYTVISLGVASLGAGATPVAETITRADLEREHGGLGAANAATDDRLVTLLARVDRTHTFFFAGTGDDTPVADRVGAIYGSFHLGGGFTFDLTVRLRDRDALRGALTSWKELRSNLNQLPPSMAAVKDVVRAVRIGANADGLRVVARLTDAQLAAMMDAIAPLLPGR